jgi:hypothetical protein
LKQITHLDNEVKQLVHEKEELCEKLCSYFHFLYGQDFEKYHVKLVVEVIRERGCCLVSRQEIFEKGYTSYIEIGLEMGGEYYPNESIPIWKCKGELFHQVGYLTTDTKEELSRKIDETIKSMLEELSEENKI